MLVRLEYFLEKFYTESVMSNQGLGSKTFLLLFLKRSSVAIVLILSVVLVFAANAISGDLGSFLLTVSLWGMLLGVLLTVGALGVTWLEYSHYSVVTDENNIRTTSGIVAEEETGIPYRRIREVKIERSMSDQVFGTGTLILTVTGEGSAQEIQIVLPALDNSLAIELQNTILKKAEVEEVDMSQKTNTP
jgi:membrane protein YdbS with pleckstrin-like domain